MSFVPAVPDPEQGWRAAGPFRSGVALRDEGDETGLAGGLRTVQRPSFPPP